MTNIAEQIQTLVEEFTAKVNDVVRRATRVHPAEPEGASLVKVYFDGDRDGNTFAVCYPTEEFRRVKRKDGSREQARMWKYTYEDATGTTNLRSWIGMLLTLDGHGRSVSTIEVYRQSGMESIDLT